MPIHYIAGDIFTNEHRASAFAIASNCEGEMNLQSSVHFRDRYPDLYMDFQRRCADEEEPLNIGDVYLYRTRDNVLIFNLALYRNRYLVMAGHRTVEDAFRQLRFMLEEAGITSIAMPPLGSGTGYLDWTRAKRSLERTFQDWEGDIYVYVKGNVREEMRHWDEADIDEDAPVFIPRGWKPAMTLYTPEARSAEKRKRSNQQKERDNASNKGTTSDSNSGSSGNSGGSGGSSNKRKRNNNRNRSGRNRSGGRNRGGAPKSE